MLRISINKVKLSKNHVMKISFAVLTALLFLFQFSFQGCKNQDLLIPESKLEEEIQMYSSKKSENYTTLYLVHKADALISEASIAKVFLDGWKYQNVVTISGYTATDDLWTIIAKEGDAYYDKVKIELTHLEIETKDWQNCMDDIYYLLDEKLPNILVID